MTGFKDGAASDDPFGSSDDADDQKETIRTDDNTETASEETSTTKKDDSTGGIPWIYRRNSITDGRDKTVQIHLQQPTLNEQREARADVEKELSESVKKADLREAALLVGLRNVKETVNQLRDWGYDVDS